MITNELPNNLDLGWFSEGIHNELTKYLGFYDPITSYSSEDTISSLLYTKRLEGLNTSIIVEFTPLKSSVMLGIATSKHPYQSRLSTSLGSYDHSKVKSLLDSIESFGKN